MVTLAEALGVLPPSDPSAPAAAPAAPDLSLKFTAKSFARGILQSAEYRTSVLRRIVFDELPPAVECKLMDYAWGKPVEHVAVTHEHEDLSTLSTKQLTDRSAQLHQYLLRRLAEEQTPTTQ